jgi:putative hydrolase of the HAD superfamily
MIGLPLEEETAHRARKQSEAWVGEQILRESRGAPRMPDDEFNRHLDRAALRTAFPDKTEDEIGHLTTRLQAVPKRKQVWKLADMVHQTLAKLKARGFTLGIVSNFDETLPELCDQFRLTPYFDAIVVSSVVGVEKPDPEILRIACRQLDASPQLALYVGDHPFDVLCARQAGMSVAWLCEPGDMLPRTVPHKPNHRIQSLADLVDM